MSADLEAELRRAEREAWNALARGKHWMYGYHAAYVVKLRRLLGRSGEPSPFRELVDVARRRMREFGAAPAAETAAVEAPNPLDWRQTAEDPETWRARFGDARATVRWDDAASAWTWSVYIDGSLVDSGQELVREDAFREAELAAELSLEPGEPEVREEGFFERLLGFVGMGAAEARGNAPGRGWSYDPEAAPGETAARLVEDGVEIARLVVREPGPGETQVAYDAVALDEHIGTFDDFTEARAAAEEVAGVMFSNPRVVRVGWLRPDEAFPTGNVPEEFARRIAAASRANIVRQTRGFYECPFHAPGDRPRYGSPGWGERMGSAEVWVMARDGTTYAAPNLIGHYVTAHHYLPPPEFIDAVLTGRFLSDDETYRGYSNPAAFERRIGQEWDSLSGEDRGTVLVNVTDPTDFPEEDVERLVALEWRDLPPDVRGFIVDAAAKHPRANELSALGTGILIGVATGIAAGATVSLTTEALRRHYRAEERERLARLRLAGEDARLASLASAPLDPSRAEENPEAVTAALLLTGLVSGAAAGLGWYAAEKIGEELTAEPDKAKPRFEWHSTGDDHWEAHGEYATLAIDRRDLREYEWHVFGEWGEEVAAGAGEDAEKTLRDAKSAAENVAKSYDEDIVRKLEAVWAEVGNGRAEEVMSGAGIDVATARRYARATLREMPEPVRKKLEKVLLERIRADAMEGTEEKAKAIAENPAGRLSPTQREVVVRMAREDAPIQRLRGGFWSTPGTPRRLDDIPEWYVDVRTLRALERLGIVARASRFPEEWRDDRVLTPEGWRSAEEVGVAAAVPAANPPANPMLYTPTVAGVHWAPALYPGQRPRWLVHYDGEAEELEAPAVRDRERRDYDAVWEEVARDPHAPTDVLVEGAHLVVAGERWYDPARLSVRVERPEPEMLLAVPVRERELAVPSPRRGNPGGRLTIVDIEGEVLEGFPETPRGLERALDRVQELADIEGRELSVVDDEANVLGSGIPRRCGPNPAAGWAQWRQVGGHPFTLRRKIGSLWLTVWHEPRPSWAWLVEDEYGRTVTTDFVPDRSSAERTAEEEAGFHVAREPPHFVNPLAEGEVAEAWAAQDTRQRQETLEAAGLFDEEAWRYSRRTWAALPEGVRRMVRPAVEIRLAEAAI